MNTNKTLILTGSITAILLLLCGAFFILGGIVNTDTNVAPGLYWKVDKPLGIGKTVVYCPPNLPAFQDARSRGLLEGGNCPDNYASMILKVAAKMKDIVSIGEDGVTVNDVLLPKSKPLMQDDEGQPMPLLSLNHYELKDNEILLMSDAPGTPFDSRYFGVIDADQVDSVITPLF